MRVAFPTNNQKTIAKHIGLAKGFLVVDTDTNERFYIENPVMKKIQQENINLKDMPEGNRGLGTGRVLPALLKEAGVDVFVADEFGEGMLRNLQAEGIKPLTTQERDINAVLESIESLKTPTVDEEIYDEDVRFGGGYGRGLGRFGAGFGRGYGRGYGYGRGFGRGRGFNRGFGRGFGRGFRGGWD